MGVLLKACCSIGCIPIDPCKWDVVNTPCRVTDSMDFAETARAEAIVTLHPHNLCDSWHISKDEDEEGTEEKHFPGAEVQAFDATCKCFKLAMEWIEE